jgi:hypothetical protein
MLVGVAAMTSCGLPSAAPEVPPSTRAQSAAPMPTAPKARGPVRIVALGDSVTSGYHCHCTAFPELYAAALGTRRRVHAAATNLGVPGLTSGELLAELTGSTTADARTQDAVAAARIVDRIRTVRDGAPTITMLTGYWNVFEDGDVADKAFPDEGVSASVALTKEANAGIRKDALAENAIYVDPYPVFDWPARVRW